MADCSKDGIRFRDGRLTDLEHLQSLDRQCFPPSIAYDRAEVAACLLSPGCFTIVAVSNRRHIAGFITVSRERTRAPALVVTIDVDPAFRRMGIGTELLEEAQSRLSAAGKTRVRLQVAVDNRAAIAFYRRLGYRTKSVIRNYYPGPLDAMEMEREL